MRKYTGINAKMTVHLASILKRKMQADMETWLPAFFWGYQAKLDANADSCDCGIRQIFFEVCDASDFPIGCLLIQYVTDVAERVVNFLLRQLQPAEKYYPVHDKKRVAMNCPLTKIRVDLIGDWLFVRYRDHASFKHSRKIRTTREKWRHGCFSWFNFPV